MPYSLFDAVAATAYWPVREAASRGKNDACHELITVHVVMLTLPAIQERDLVSYPCTKLEKGLGVAKLFVVGSVVGRSGLPTWEP